MTSDPTSLWWSVGVVAAYVAACGGWLGFHRLLPRWWPQPQDLRSDRKWMDLSFALIAVALVIGIGQVYNAGWLLPQPAGWVGTLTWQLNNLIIYSPLVIVLAHRGQSPETAYLSLRGLPVKLVIGALLGAVAVILFLAIAGGLDRLPGLPAATIRGENLKNLLPVFLEGVVLAFVFVRLQWSLGLWPAIVLPALLFAAAHIPRQLQSETAPAEMVVYFAVTAFVAAAVLLTMRRSRDVVWITIVHYLMDIAIGAFGS